ncbi:anti-sigma factor family protein [Undibacterium sp. Ji49W]|uniref:anti-sigma factor family protein n=1 Tax=Undibacterium sp. Ji49W TaxID=3413040 RepID=UPI003BEF6D99
MKQAPISEADLHAYVDAQLSPARQAEVEAHLQAYPDDARKVEAWRQQNASLHLLFDSVMQEALPDRLVQVPVDRLPVRRTGWGWQPLAAGVAIAFVSAGMGWFANDLHGKSGEAGLLALGPGQVPRVGVQNAAAFAHQAAVAHLVYSPDARRPVEIGAEQETQLVAWLSKRIGSPMHAPKLGKLSYELVGGRLLPGGSGPVAQFMYQDASGQRLTLYVSTDQVHNKDTGFKFMQEDKVNVFYWIDGKFGYALSGNISKTELARIASAVYEQLDKPS